MNRAKYIFIIIIVIFIIMYFIFINNKHFNNFISDVINNKYNDITINFEDKLLYNSFVYLIDKEYKDIPVNKEVSVIEEKTIIKDPIVYIYNSHDYEEYKMPFISDYSIIPTVKHASFMLRDYLNDLGISSKVEKRSINSYLKKHNLNYYGCYDASRSYLLDELNKHDYKILLDIHRDSVKKNKTTVKINNLKYAKVMFVLTTKHKNYKKNEKFVNYLNNYINKNYKGLSRGIMKRKDVIFNQDLITDSILIELGGVDNTIDELNRTIKVLGDALYKYIKEKKYD